MQGLFEKYLVKYVEWGIKVENYNEFKEKKLLNTEFYDLKKIAAVVSFLFWIRFALKHSTPYALSDFILFVLSVCFYVGIHVFVYHPGKASPNHTFVPIKLEWGVGSRGILRTNYKRLKQNEVFGYSRVPEYRGEKLDYDKKTYYARLSNGREVIVEYYVTGYVDGDEKKKVCLKINEDMWNAFWDGKDIKCTTFKGGMVKLTK